MRTKLDIIQLPVGQMQANCYILSNPVSCETIVIDPGDDAEFIIEHIEKLDTRILAVLLTHGHFDHCMAAWQVCATYSIPCYLHEDDVFLIDRMQESVKYFLGYEDLVLRQKITQLSRVQNIFKIGKYIFTLFFLAGHTPGCTGFYIENENIIFSGDVIFSSGGIGRTDFSYSNPLIHAQSIDKLLRLPSNTVIYPGHGKSTMVSYEKQYRSNKNLRN